MINRAEQNELMSRKHKKVYTSLNHTEHFLILASTITECIIITESITAFASLLGILYKVCNRIKNLD